MYKPTDNVQIRRRALKLMVERVGTRKVLQMLYKKTWEHIPEKVHDRVIRDMNFIETFSKQKKVRDSSA